MVLAVLPEWRAREAAVNLRCYHCLTWQEAHPRHVQPVGVDVWVCRICKRDQFARDGATPKMREHMLWLLELEQRERQKAERERRADRAAWRSSGDKWL